MKKNYVLFFVFMIAGCHFNVNTNRNVTSKDKGVTWDNCYKCHAPEVVLEGMPLAKMYNHFGEKELLSYLKSEFRGNCQVGSHCQVKLTTKEVESVFIYLREIKL